MALVLNGDGTVTGLAVGGLPDGTVDSGTIATGTILPADMANGGNKVVQIVHVQDGALASGTTLIPHDNTIPQITEGDEYMTLAITPTSATNMLLIEVSANTNNGTTGIIMAHCLFVGTTANALATVGHRNASSNHESNHRLVHKMTAGVTTELTFRYRAGGHSANTTNFNGHGTVAYYGGTYASTMTITEYEV